VRLFERRPNELGRRGTQNLPLGGVRRSAGKHTAPDHDHRPSGSVCQNKIATKPWTPASPWTGKVSRNLIGALALCGRQSLSPLRLKNRRSPTDHSRDPGPTPRIGVFPRPCLPPWRRPPTLPRSRRMKPSRPSSTIQVEARLNVGLVVWVRLRGVVRRAPSSRAHLSQLRVRVQSIRYLPLRIYRQTIHRVRVPLGHACFEDTERTHTTRAVAAGSGQRLSTTARFVAVPTPVSPDSQTESAAFVFVACYCGHRPPNVDGATSHTLWHNQGQTRIRFDTQPNRCRGGPRITRSGAAHRTMAGCGSEPSATRRRQRPHPTRPMAIAETQGQSGAPLSL